MKTLAWVLILASLAWTAWLYRDKLAEWWPGLKHALSGWFTIISGGMLSLLQFLQGQEGTIAKLLTDKPLAAPLVMLTLGALILVLSWVTPRKAGEQ
jgi:hypothetical protein